MADQPKVHDYLHELNKHSFGKIKECITVGEMSATSVENCIGSQILIIRNLVWSLVFII